MDRYVCLFSLNLLFSPEEIVLFLINFAEREIYLFDHVLITYSAAINIYNGK